MFKKQSIIEALAAGSNCIPPPPPPLPPAPVNHTICGFNVAYRIDGQYPEWVGYLLSQMTMDAPQKTANLENSGKPFCMDSIPGPRCKIYRFVIYIYMLYLNCYFGSLQQYHPRCKCPGNPPQLHSFQVGCLFWLLLRDASMLRCLSFTC